MKIAEKITEARPNSGCLHDVGWLHDGAIDIMQGEDMGVRSVLRTKLGKTRGEATRVSGTTRATAVADRQTIARPRQASRALVLNGQRFQRT
jgi:hypothetical protein